MLLGGWGADTLRGGDGNDFIFGSSSNDTIWGDDTQLLCRGRPANDHAWGRAA